MINLAGTSALTFSDEFNTLSLYNPATGAAGTWNPLLRGFNPEGSSNIWGHEIQFNVNPYFDYNRNGIDDTPSPFSVKDGVLTITAQPMDAVFKADVNRTITEGYWPSATRMTYDYSSGFLSTANSFSQTYGYFEMRAQLAPGAGMWSAFWLLPQDGTWPPEIDVVELLGRDPTTSYHSVHSSLGPNGHSMASGSLTGLDATGSYHTYGLNWQSDYLTYYVDGKEVFKTATPSDMNKPMYMIANLAIGDSTSWPGTVNSSTTFPAEMKIDYIRAYSAMPVEPVTPVEPVQPVEPVAPVIGQIIVGTSRADILKGGEGNDEIRGLNGNDSIWGMGGDEILTGGAGRDTFFFGAGFGKDIITDFEVGKRGDFLSFSLDVFKNVQDVKAHASQVGANTIIVTDDGASLTLMNTKLAMLGSANLAFA